MDLVCRLRKIRHMTFKMTPAWFHQQLQLKLEKKSLNQTFPDYPKDLDKDSKAAASFMKGKFVSLYRSVSVFDDI